MELQAHGAEGEEGGAEGEDHQDGENPNADDAEEEKDGEEDREQEGGEEIYENIREMTINLLLISNHEEQAEAAETVAGVGAKVPQRQAGTDGGDEAAEGRAMAAEEQARAAKVQGGGAEEEAVVGELAAVFWKEALSWVREDFNLLYSMT